MTEVSMKITEMSDFRFVAEYVACAKRPEALEQLFSDRENTIKHPEEFLDLMSEISTDKRYLKIKELLSEEEKENMTMCVMVDKFWGEGRTAGIEEGINNLNKLNAALISDSRIDDLLRAAFDDKYQKQYMKEYGLL